MSAGYTSRVILLAFPKLGDRVSVLIRNPKLLPPSELTPQDIAVDAQGNPLDPQAANEAMYKVMANLIVAWRVYDASAPAAAVTIDLDADPEALAEQLDALETVDQTLMTDITAENVARLPMAIINRIGEELAKVADPS
ncbi:hypothetical protein DT019_02825 [Streptomyces sp. SDr-06]|uniref:hypothetical protein n=1 Tax=Streptomyces sp. SDr-06 TaxID=2267702 RepID=UPI000DE90A9D|nr:hypothetical protein [Streptomyces sp. SDr-06]RCH70436.1 hypothetical protein DT019_02825 [Streptomyces sp. SDr-06]